MSSSRSTRRREARGATTEVVAAKRSTPWWATVAERAVVFGLVGWLGGGERERESWLLLSLRSFYSNIFWRT